MDKYQRSKISLFKVYIIVLWSQGDIVYSINLWELKHLLSHQISNNCHILIIKNTRQGKAKKKKVYFQPSIVQIILPIECCLSNMGRQTSYVILLCCLGSKYFCSFLEGDITLSDIHLGMLVKSHSHYFVTTCSYFIKVKDDIWKNKTTEVKILNLLN